MYRLVVYGTLLNLEFFEKVTGERPLRIEDGSFRAKVFIGQERGPQAIYHFPIVVPDEVSGIIVRARCLELELDPERTRRFERSLELYEGELYRLSDVNFITTRDERLPAKVFAASTGIIPSHINPRPVTESETFYWPLHALAC